jgi:hypothetical protein
MLKCTNLKKLTLGALVLAAVGLAGRAEAACDPVTGVATPVGSACYILKGSDTLFDIVTAAINGARAGSITAGGTTITFTPVPGATDLFYAGTGSGNAETAMSTATATGIGAQSIGPMSRNFRPAFIDPAVPGWAPRTAAALTATGHAAWAPNVSNVVGLDAAVFVVKATGALDNIDFTTFLDSSVPSAFKKSNINNAAIATNFGNGNGFGNIDPACTTCAGAACSATCVNYNSVMSIILSGVDGSGTIAACADPRRVQAIQDVAGNLGATTLSHLFRRDDNSGTTDTFKDRIMVVKNTGAQATRYVYTGGRFCNGTAIGQITSASAQQGICSVSRATTCFTNADCAASGAGQVCQYNLNNQDFDPIRRPCTPSDATRAPTTCTDMTTGARCLASDNNPNCTQGFIVALSDTDPGASDITVSIGKRVGLGDGSVIGYAGREAALNTGAKALKVNTIGSTDDNVRPGTYLLARRLFIQNTFVNSVDANDIPTDTETANSVKGGGNDQLTKEQALWTAVLSNRTLMDPIVRQYNFIRCAAAGDGADPSLESGNLCGVTPASPVPGALSAYTPSGSFGASNTGGAKSINSAGRVWTATGAVQATCAAGALCVSGLACPAVAPLVCPDAAKLPANAPCTLNSDCTSNSCTDKFTHSTGGKDGLYCN